MITRQQMLEAADDPVIRALNVGAFAPEDVVNLILQRSEIIGDQKYPGKVVQA